MVGEIEWAGFDLDVDHLIRLGIEGGYDFGSTLVYATAGFAELELSAGGATADGSGYFYGLGADYRISDSFTIGAELLQHELDASGDELDMLTLGVNVAFTF